MLKKLMNTEDDLGALIARLALGLVMFPHGAQKTLGWFAGLGFTHTVNAFSGMGMPRPVAMLVIVAEFFGALGLIAGLLGRVAAAGIAGVMVGAVVIVHWKYGFFMNWFGNQPGEGYEYHILALALALVVLVKGSGRWSLDRMLTK